MDLVGFLHKKTIVSEPFGDNFIDIKRYSIIK